MVGYSAGSLGAAVWAPWIADQYRGATRRTYFGDSFVGVTASGVLSATPSIGCMATGLVHFKEVSLQKIIPRTHIESIAG